MSFNEDNLQVTAHGRESLEDRGDVAGLVPGWYDDRNAWIVVDVLRLRPGNDEVGKGQLSERPEPHEDLVEQAGEGQRYQDLMPRANRLKPGQSQHPVGVDGSKPVLRQHWGREPQRLGDREGQLPKAAVEVDNQACGRVTQPAHLLEGDLDVPDIIHQVREDDDVELLVQAGKVVRVRPDEFEIRMARTGALQHLLREVDANAAGRFERGE